MSPHAFRALLCACLLPVSARASDNLIFNGGFELDAAGFERNQYQRLDRNPTMAFESLLVDTATKFSGTQSLRVPNRHGERIEVFVHGVTLKPDTWYTFSLRMRSEVAGLRVTPLFVGDSYYPANAWTFTVGTAWQRYSFSRKTLPDEVFGHTIWITVNEDGANVPNDVWFEEVQLVEGRLPNGSSFEGEVPSMPFAPSAEVEVAVATDHPLYFGSDQIADTRVTLTNSTARAVQGRIDLRLEDDDGGAPQIVGAVQVALAAGERRELAVPVPLPRYGAFTLVPVPRLDATAAVLPAWFDVAGLYVPAQAHLDPATTFCVGAISGLHNGRGPAGTIRGCNAAPDTMLATYAKMGGRLIRFWERGQPHDWAVVQPTSGDSFEFAYSDYVVGKVYDNGIAMLPVLGGSWLTPTDPTKASHWPAWLLAAGKIVPSQPYFYARGSSTLLPPEAAWRHYVSTMVGRYKDKITHWEITNEPNIWIVPNPDSARTTAAQEYNYYLRAAAEEIRAADPAARIVGFSSTGDMGGGALKFLQDCFAAGGLQYADAVSFHPYDSGTLGSANPADQAIANIHAAAGGATPIWDTELYYLAGTPTGDPRVIRPRHVATRFLTDLGEGLAQSAPANDETLWRRTINPGFGGGDAMSSWLPSAALVAYNALARYFEGATPVVGGKIALSPEAICYVYLRRGGSPIAACWTYRPTSDQPLTLSPALAGTIVLDVFGNPVASPGGTFTVGPTPRYLVPPAGMSAADFIAALRAAPLPVVNCAPVGVRGVGDKTTLRTAVTAIPGRTITKVAFSADGVPLGSATYNATSGLWERVFTTTKAGRIAIAAAVTDSTGAVRTGTKDLVVGSLGTHGNGGQPWAVPLGATLRVEAEDFDEGGEGAAYHDSDAMRGDWTGRSAGTLNEVDLSLSKDETRTDPDPNDPKKTITTITVRNEGLIVSNSANGEWLRYTVTLPATAAYGLRLRVADAVGSGYDYPPKPGAPEATVTVKWNGVATTIPIGPQTATWNTFKDIVATTPVLAAGTGTLEIVFDVWGYTLNWFEIGPAPVVGNIDPVIVDAGTPNAPVTLVCAAGGTGTLALAATDADGDSLKWSMAALPKAGTATVDPFTGVLTYTTSANTGVTDSCFVRVADGRGGQDTIRVYLDAKAVNAAPVAAVNPLSGPLVVGVPVVLTATAFDPDGLLQSVTFDANGSAIGTGTCAASGWGVRWTPATAGAFSITAKATDSRGATGAVSAAVSMQVIARGTSLTVTDECGTAAPVTRLLAAGIDAEDVGTIQPFGDGTKFVPHSQAMPGTALWAVRDASAVWFSYALTDGQPGSVTVEASPDGIAFTALGTVTQSVGPAGGWHIYDAAAAALPSGTNFVRFTLSSVGAVNNWDVALLWVQIDSVAGGGSATPVALPADFKVSLVPVAGPGGQIQLVFGPVQAGWTYTPEFCTDLATGNWVRLTAFTQSDNGAQRTLTDLSASGARRFYRIRVVPTP